MAILRWPALEVGGARRVWRLPSGQDALELRQHDLLASGRLHVLAHGLAVPDPADLE